MKFFIDTSNLEEIKELKKSFPVSGVTTNPTLMAQSGSTVEKLIPQICEVVQAPVSAEVLETQEEPMFKEALKLAELHPHVVVKVPLIPEGLKVVTRLEKKGIQTNVTLCFSPLQALQAALSGATMVSIFVGRLDDIGQSGMQVVSDTIEIFSNYSLKTQVLVASVRHTQHIHQAALLGADIVTAPYKLLKSLAHHPLTDIGLEKFLASAKK